MIQVDRLAAGALERELDNLARLRIAVFRDYPYLYEGSLDYERRYLRSFASSRRSVLVVARDGEQVVGAATAMPLAEHGDDVAGPLSSSGYDVQRIYYFGESVLLHSYRGRGIGHAFFDQREDAALQHGFSVCAFCAVERPGDHPQKPADYRPLDAFWRGRGYVRHDQSVAHFSWRDLGTEGETEKRMVFWTKELT